MTPSQDGVTFVAECKTMPPKLTKEIIDAAILGFEEQKSRIDAQIAELHAMLSPAEPASEPAKPPRRKMSAAGRRAIAEAQRKRWAAKKAGTAAAANVAPKKKRRLSAAGRAAIVAASKRRWAAKKAAA